MVTSVLQVRLALRFVLALSANAWTFSIVTSASGVELASWDVANVELDDDPSGIDDSPASAPYTFSGVLGANIATGELTLSSAVNRSTTLGQYGFKISGGSEESTLAGAASPRFVAASAAAVY